MKAVKRRLAFVGVLFATRVCCISAQGCPLIKDGVQCSERPTCQWDRGYQRCFMMCYTHKDKASCMRSDICKWDGGRCLDSNAFACPEPGKSRNIRPRPMAPLILYRTKMGELCTLVKLDRGNLKPIARSYEGSPWEATAGEAAEIRYACNKRQCKAWLPEAIYQLTTFEHTITSEQDASRFLEQATFGPTRETIASFTGRSKWIKEQIYAMPISSHRQFFRQRVNMRLEAPSRTSTVTQPCDQGTRYRRYAFTRSDYDRYVEVRRAPRSMVYLLVRGQARTVVGQTIVGMRGGIGFPFPATNGRYKICQRPEDSVGSDLFLVHPENGCSKVMFNGVSGNPAVVFYPDIPPTTNPTLTLRPFEVKEVGDQELYVRKALSDSKCSLVPRLGSRSRSTAGSGFITAAIYREKYYLHDPRSLLASNTIEGPLNDGGGAVVKVTSYADSSEAFVTACSNAPRTFVNEDHCVLSTDDDICRPTDTLDVTFPLEYESFKKVFELTGGTKNAIEDDKPGTRYVYAIDGLRNDPDFVKAPCTRGRRSRWLKVPVRYCDNERTIDWPYDKVTAKTKSVFAKILETSPDRNPYLRDVVLPIIAAKSCEANTYNFTVKTAGECWRNVDPELFNVYDFTSWVSFHPGGPSKIQSFSQGDDAQFRLVFPHWHGMERWYDYGRPRVQKIGRLGDVVAWRDLPTAIASSQAVAAAFGAEPVIREQGAAVVCGSPFEVSNQLRANGGKMGQSFDMASDRTPADRGVLLEQSSTVFMELALHAPDQLRQRVAFALSQILVVSPDAIKTQEQTEHFLVYYDIFVRHAFGNYRDVLKEVSFSPMMAEMLSYLESKSTAYSWENGFNLEYADENFAREVMQLFSIGLNMIGQDGTIRTFRGVPRRSYTNLEVAEYARVWTGFARQKSRGNIEEPSGDVNRVDPMRIMIEWRDHMPKLGLMGRYIGDGWPLCSDLPHRHFLRAGATFRLLGSRPDPEYLEDPQAWGELDRPALEYTSQLYHSLCNANDGICNYKTKVVLEQDLDTCVGVECQVETLRVFRVAEVYYEYLRQPCVQQAFYSGARLVKQGSGTYMCANPRSEVAAIACCSERDNRADESGSLYSGERATFQSAKKRCNLCDNPFVKRCGPGGCDKSLYYWTGRACQLQIKIDPEGKVAIVHAAPSVSRHRMNPAVKEDSKVFFRVKWSSGLNPFVNGYYAVCQQLGCKRDFYDKMCLCDVAVTETIAFTEKPSLKEALSKLHVGAFEPTYPAFEKAEDNRVSVYSRKRLYTKDTIIALVDQFGIHHLRKNVISMVNVGNGKLQFRNPVHFIPLSDPETRDAYFETDAALDHYFYHPNTAPFLAIRLAQRFVSSNPSPRYIRQISTAFVRGTYTDVDGETFGSGKYGDLAATIAAVLLDQEARVAVLDADPVHGALQEPYLKVVRLMRSLEYKGDEDRPMIALRQDLQELLGEEPQRFPSVFSFFKPEFAPGGRVSNAGLVAPEAEILTGPRVLSFLNGGFSLLKYGLSAPFGGFGYSRNYVLDPQDIMVGDYSQSYGHLTLTVQGRSTAVIDELATLLTCGRLSNRNRELVQAAYEDTLAAGKGVREALINAEQLIILSPEFNTKSLLLGDSEGLRSHAVPVTKSTRPYKALVQIHLDGGMDAYNMLAPHICAKNAYGETLREQYDRERGQVAFTPEERKLIINAVSSIQPCKLFALHDELTTIKKLYTDKDLLFFANIGVVNDVGLTKANHERRMATTLYAHNEMVEEIHRVDPYLRKPGTGVLGRMADQITKNRFMVNTLSIDCLVPSVYGKIGKSPSPVSVSRDGSFFLDRPSREQYFDIANKSAFLNPSTQLQSSIFGDTWSNEVEGAIDAAEKLKGFNAVELSKNWDTGKTGQVWGRFRAVAKLIKTRQERGVDRDLFYVPVGGWDHHVRMKEQLRDNFQNLNQGLRLLVSEMKEENVWDQIVIVLTSDFGRTLTPNSGDGVDHAWGTHSFMMGGSVKGGRILGEYPDDISPTGYLNVGRGRIMPTTPWDAMWSGVAEWMGVSTEQLNAVLPNRKNVMQLRNFHAGDLFEP